MKWLHDLLKGATLTTALFIFEACYGPGVADRNYDMRTLEFDVVSSSTGKPIPNIKLLFKLYSPEDDWTTYGTTDSEGRISLHSDYDFENESSFLFVDPNSAYQSKDTSLVFPDSNKKIVIALNESKR